MMTKKSIAPLVVLIVAGLTGGCVATSPGPASQANLPERMSLPPVQQSQPEPGQGSLFSDNSLNIYQDSRARSVGDIIMVKIAETSSGSKKAETTTSRDSSISGGVSSLFGYEKIFRGRHAQSQPSLTSMNTNLAKEFTGTGETSRDSKVTATVSARVIEVTLDGNLVIRGFREVRVNNETQHIIVSGLVRPQDISKDNSVLSSYLADARIEYSGTGIISDKQQPGWFSSVLDVVWPF